MYSSPSKKTKSTPTRAPRSFMWWPSSMSRATPEPPSLALTNGRPDFADRFEVAHRPPGAEGDAGTAAPGGKFRRLLPGGVRVGVAGRRFGHDEAARHD